MLKKITEKGNEKTQPNLFFETHTIQSKAGGGWSSTQTVYILDKLPAYSETCPHKLNPPVIHRTWNPNRLTMEERIPEEIASKLLEKGWMRNNLC